jgi:hypothetical protein
VVRGGEEGRRPLQEYFNRKPRSPEEWLRDCLERRKAMEPQPETGAQHHDGSS